MNCIRCHIRMRKVLHGFVCPNCFHWYKYNHGIDELKEEG